MIIENNKISIKEWVIEIQEWMSFLKSKLKIILIVTMFGSLVGLAIAVSKKVTYKAVLSFALEEDKGGGGSSGLGGALGLASSLGIDLGGGSGGAFAANNLAELMKSYLMVKKVLLKPIEIKGKITTLAEYYITINQLKKGWYTSSEFKNIHYLPNENISKFTFQQDSILHDIYKSLIGVKNLNISQKDRKTTILTIEVYNQDEIFAKLFCENLAFETSFFYIETKSKKSRTNVNILQKQVDSVKSELNIAISGVAKEVDNVYNLNPAYNIKGAPSKKKQIDVSANTAILTNLVVQLELAKITQRKETPLIQLIDRPFLPLEKYELDNFFYMLFGGISAAIIFTFFLILKNIYNRIIA
jgi:hypothetical protein